MCFFCYIGFNPSTCLLHTVCVWEKRGDSVLPFFFFGGGFYVFFPGLWVRELWRLFLGGEDATPNSTPTSTKNTRRERHNSQDIFWWLHSCFQFYAVAKKTRKFILIFKKQSFKQAFFASFASDQRRDMDEPFDENVSFAKKGGTIQEPAAAFNVNLWSS